MLIYLLSIGVGVVSFLAITKYGIAPRNIVLFFSVWAALYLFEFYILGANSYIHMDEEGDHYIPFFKYLVDYHLGGQFAHRVGGGVDIYGSFIPSIQLVSPELFLLSVLPVWLAYLVHLAIMLCVGFWGAYLLCHNTSNCQTSTSLAAASFFTVSNYSFFLASYPIGAGLAFLPLTIYVLVCRLHAPRYYLFAVPVALANAIYVIPTWTAEALYAGVILAAVMLRTFHFRLVVALFLLTAFLLINWAEPLYAIFEMSAYTDRGRSVGNTGPFLAEMQNAAGHLLSAWGDTPVFYVFFAAVAFLWFAKDAAWVRGAVTFLLFCAGYMLVILFPWHSIGLGPVSRLSHHYALLALTALVLPLVSRSASLSHYPRLWGWQISPQTVTSVVLALSVAGLIHFKLYNAVSFLYHGGQSQYHSIKSLNDPSWQPDEPFRVLTLRVRELGPEPAIPYGLYGMESFDAFMNMRPTSWSEYYNIGILKGTHTDGGVDSRVFASWSQWRDGAYQDIDRQLSLPLLALANVRFILSPLPIATDKLRKVAGPETPVMTLKSRPLDYSAYMRDRLKRLITFNDLYVYEISNAYPQVYAPQRIVEIANETDARRTIDTIRASLDGPGRVAVVRENEGQATGLSGRPVKINRFNRIRDGYEIFVEAPDGGMVVVNTHAVPFWKAFADGRQLDILTVNKIQMGVALPAGTEKVIFRYHRPSVVDKITSLSF